MPPKLSKRQQRELEELEALKANQLHDVSSDDDDGLPSSVTQNTRVSASFSHLMAAEESETETDHAAQEAVVKSGSSKSRKPKKRKKKEATVGTAPPPSRDPESSKSTGTGDVATPVTKSEKKALKKAKAKGKKSGMDELDEALAELALRYPEMHKSSMSSAESQSLAKFLSVSLAHLDSEAELRKFFGSKVVQASKTFGGPSSSSGRRQGVSAAVRSHLTKPKPTWWAAKQREGLSARTCTEEEVKEIMQRHGWDAVGEEKWWTVEYSKKYKSMTKAFMGTVMSGDPQGFWDLLGKLPWHADTLLQVAEVYRHREEWAQAVDFVDRALFTYERSFIGTFNFTSGQNRMDFDRVENRPFFLAIHRQISDLQRRGCVRAAFEFAKLLYSLEPWSDPHGALFHLDLLALKAPGMNQWLLDVYDVFSLRRLGRSQESRDTRMDPSVLPGWMYSRALALWMSEDTKKDRDHKASSEALKEAILTFPSVVPLLADKTDTSIPDSIRAHKDFKIEVDGARLSLANAMLHMLSHLYAQHAFSIWKDPAHNEWFTSVLSSLSTSLPPCLPATPERIEFLRLYEKSSNLRYSAYRHVVVLESSYRRLFSFIPEKVSNSRSLACDPLPPLSAVTRYDDTFFEGVEDTFSMFGTRTRRQREADRGRIARFDEGLLRHVQELLNAFPQVAENHGGDALQLMQELQEMPEGLLEDVLAQLQITLDERDEGRMPGNFDNGGVDVAGHDERHDVVEHGGVGGGQVEEEGVGGEDEDDEDEDEDEEAPSALLRGFRNVLGRLWGARFTNEESTSEDEARPVDDTGVD
ncbi:hypothetical protein AX15_007010 [Amanita polypyramis BW_CC]|nr:hypothetical protein AX15_007010 [Amanita polypyramis BW_CC]